MFAASGVTSVRNDPDFAVGAYYDVHTVGGGVVHCTLVRAFLASAVRRCLDSVHRHDVFFPTDPDFAVGFYYDVHTVGGDGGGLYIVHW